MSVLWQAENHDLDGPRAGMPDDVFLQASQGPDQAAAPSAEPATGEPEPIITLEGGGQIHVGPHVRMKTTGGAVHVSKGSKLAVSQFAKVIAD